MENYKEMYLTLFKAISDAKEILEKAQIKAEEIYIEKEDIG